MEDSSNNLLRLIAIRLVEYAHWLTQSHWRVNYIGCHQEAHVHRHVTVGTDQL